MATFWIVEIPASILGTDLWVMLILVDMPGQPFLSRGVKVTVLGLSWISCTSMQKVPSRLTLTGVEVDAPTWA